MGTYSKTVPNLIQGISQQVSAQARDTQARQQYDCINSALEGADARPGLELVAFYPEGDGEGEFPSFANAYFYPVWRSRTENYVVTIFDGAEVPLKVFNLADGEECAVDILVGMDDDGATAYLTDADPKLAFAAATIEDTTFLVNRNVQPEMDADLSPQNVPCALLFFRQGNYLTTYQVTIRGNFGVGGAFTELKWRYTTPDNSVPENGAFITSNRIAASFFYAMTGTSPTPGEDGPGVGSAGEEDGDTGNYEGSEVLGDYGFDVSINGNVILIQRSEGPDEDVDFTIETGDGLGDTFFYGIKGTIASFGKLPPNAFDGFQVTVKGQSSSRYDDYYMQFRKPDGEAGFWEEIVKPGISYKLDPTTMPYKLVNTAPNAFQVRAAEWDERIAGDDRSAPEPYFVGRNIKNIANDNTRLAFITEGTASWSKSRNPYTHFPDTVQARLSEAPINVKLSGTKQIALLEGLYHASEATLIFGQSEQFRVSSSQEVFKEDTIESKPLTAFDFAPLPGVRNIGSSNLFVSEGNEWATVYDLTIADAKLRGDEDITEHVGKLIPSGVQYLIGTSLMKMAAAFSMGAPNRIFLYNYLVQNQQRLQSAWNIWRIPSAYEVIWVEMRRTTLYAMLRRPFEGAFLVKCDLSINQTDAFEAAEYLTRMDLRVHTSQLEVPEGVWNNSTDVTDFELPYAPQTDVDREFFAVVAESSGDFIRGTQLEVTDIDGNTVSVRGNYEGASIFFGYQIIAEREEMPFYLRGEAGNQQVESIVVDRVELQLARTGYTRIEVQRPERPEPYIKEFEGRVLGDVQNEFNKVVLSDRTIESGIGAENTEATVKFVNDTWLPSRWQTAQYHFQAVIRSTPMGAGGKKGGA